MRNIFFNANHSPIGAYASFKEFTYYAPTEVFFGCGKINEVADIVKRYGNKVLLVTGSGSSSIESSKKVKEMLEAAGIQVAHFSGVKPNPTTDQVTAGADMVKELHRNIFPKAAIVDPELTKSMPKAVTAQTGFDAFCHNFEAYLSVNASPLVETMALEAINIIAKYLPKALEDGADMEARSQMSWADTLGGLTNSNAGVTLPHGLGMQVGGHCPQVTHGQALAAFYPAFTRYTCQSAVEKFAAVGRIFNQELENETDETAAQKCCEEINDFLKKIGLWINYKELGVSMEDIREIADCGQVLGDYLNNPRVASIEEMYQLLTESYEKA